MPTASSIHGALGGARSFNDLKMIYDSSEMVQDLNFETPEAFEDV